MAANPSSTRSALLIINVQNDFVDAKTGTVCVPGAAEIVPVIAALRQFSFDLVVNAVSWYPANHTCFSSNNPGSHAGDKVTLASTGSRVIATPHCIQDTLGAAVHDGAGTLPSDIVIHMGINPHSDAYSAFRDNIGKVHTPLLDVLTSCSVNQLFCVGLPFDKCVLYTALDAKMLTEAKVFVIEDACRASSDAARRDAYAMCDQEHIPVISSTDTAIRRLGPAARVMHVPTKTALKVVKDNFLLDSCMRLDVANVQYALTNGSDRTAQPLPLGMNALHIVCSIRPSTAKEVTRVIQILKLLLLDAPSNYVNAPTSSASQKAGGWTPLMLCCSTGRADVARILLTLRPVLTSKEREENLTALMIAARGGHWEIVSQLMHAGAAKTLDSVSRFAKTALMYAFSAVGPNVPVVASTALVNVTRVPLAARSSDISDSVDSKIGITEMHDMYGPITPGMASALRCVKALVEGLSADKLVELLLMRDSDGWTALHFAAKSGTLQHVPWRRLLEAKDLRRLEVGSLTSGGASLLHIAAWNGQYGVCNALMHHMRGFPTGYSPWASRIPRNSTIGSKRLTAVDLAMLNQDPRSTSLLFRAGCFAQEMSGPRCDEALERAMLEFDVIAMEAILRRPENKVAQEANLLNIIQHIKYPNSCTFTFAGYNNPMNQHMYRCASCSRKVCLVCAVHCHEHQDADFHALLPVNKHLSPLGFQATRTYCECPRSSCRCVPAEEARLYQFVPRPIDTSTIRLAVQDGALVAEKSLEAKAAEPVYAGSGPASVLSSLFNTHDEELTTLPPAVLKLVEIMARNDHAVWAMGKLRAGWSYGEIRNDELQKHPMLMPFSKLSESSQSSNCKSALQQLKLIKAVDFRVVLPEGDAMSHNARRITGPSVLTHTANLPSDVDFGLVQDLLYDRIDTSGVNLTDDHYKLVELLSRNSHEEWAKSQMSKGVVYAPGPAQDGDAATGAPKTSPLLVPFELLPPEYQTSNRATAEEMVKLLVQLGNQLQPNSTDEYDQLRVHTKNLRNAEADKIRRSQERREHLRRRFWSAMLQRAARIGNAELVQDIMSLKSTKPEPTPNCWCDVLLQTPLHLAAKGNHVAVVRKLVNLGAKLEARDAQGLTPLATAAVCGHRDVCVVLLRLGADPSVLDNFGLSPMHHAAFIGSTGCVAVFARQLQRLQETGRLAAEEVGSGSWLGQCMPRRRGRLHRFIRWLQRPKAVAAVDRLTGLAPSTDLSGEDGRPERSGRAARVSLLAHMLQQCDSTTFMRVVRKLSQEDYLDLTIKPKYLADITDDEDAFAVPVSFARRMTRLLCCMPDPTRPAPPGRSQLLNRMSPLSLAVKARRMEVMDLLLKFDADPTLPDFTGMSPYDRALRDHVACLMQTEELTAALREQNRQFNENLLREQAAAKALAEARVAASDGGSSMDRGSSGKLSISSPTSAMQKKGSILGRPVADPPASGFTVNSPQNALKAAGSSNRLLDRQATAVHASSQRLEDTSNLARSTASSERSLNQVIDMSIAAVVRARLEDHTAATKEARKRELALKKFSRRDKEITAIIGHLNASRHAQQQRRHVAYGEVFMGLMMISVILLAFALVSPFWPTYNIPGMRSASAEVQSRFESTFLGVTDQDGWWNWTRSTMAGIGNERTGLLQSRPDGTLHMFGLTLVGGIQLRVTQEEAAGSGNRTSLLISAESESAAECDIPVELQPVLGACGGAGIAIPASGHTIASGVLNEVQWVNVIGGNRASMQRDIESLHTMVPPVLSDTTTQVELALSLYHALTGAFIGVQLTTTGTGAGTSPGSLTPTVDVSVVRLFSDRFPPSVWFEVVIVAVMLSQVVVVAVRYRASALRWTEFLFNSDISYDLLWFGCFLMVFIHALIMRIMSADLLDDIVSTASASGAMSTIANAGSRSSSAVKYIDVISVADQFRTLSDWIAVTLVLACSMILKILKMMPTLGPMVVAVLNTCKDNTVLLYLGILTAGTIVFALAFHTSLGPQSDDFGRLNDSILTLATYMVGEVGPFLTNPQRILVTWLFIGFLVFFSIMVLNLFIGVTTELYPIAKKTSEQQWQDLITGLMQQPFYARLATAAADSTRRASSENTAKMVPAGKGSSRALTQSESNASGSNAESPLHKQSSRRLLPGALKSTSKSLKTRSVKSIMVSPAHEAEGSERRLRIMSTDYADPETKDAHVEWDEEDFMPPRPPSGLDGEAPAPESDELSDIDGVGIDDQSDGASENAQGPEDEDDDEEINVTIPGGSQRQLAAGDGENSRDVHHIMSAIHELKTKLSAVSTFQDAGRRRMRVSTATVPPNST